VFLEIIRPEYIWCRGLCAFRHPQWVGCGRGRWIQNASLLSLWWNGQHCLTNGNSRRSKL